MICRMVDEKKVLEFKLVEIVSCGDFTTDPIRWDIIGRNLNKDAGIYCSYISLYVCSCNSIQTWFVTLFAAVLLVLTTDGAILWALLHL